MSAIDPKIVERAAAERRAQQTELVPRDTAKVVEITAWRYARRLAIYPFVATKKGQQEVSYDAPDGSFSVRGTRLDGIPTVWDLDVFEFVLNKGRELVSQNEGFPEVIKFTVPEACRALELHSNSGKNRERILGAIERFGETSYVSERKGENGDWSKEAHTMWTYKLDKTNKQDTRVEITLHSNIVKAARAGQMNALSPGARKMLLEESRSGLKKMLIRLISARLGRQKSLTLYEPTLIELTGSELKPRKFRETLRRQKLPWQLETEKTVKGWKYTFYA